ncbi:MAG: hypothetical protein M3362_21635, partial [Acidobacteriota bacterium]|nr:hypothetical protein [Acidobacteriota bacterium]
MLFEIAGGFGESLGSSFSVWPANRTASTVPAPINPKMQKLTINRIQKFSETDITDIVAAPQALTAPKMKNTLEAMIRFGLG